MELPVCYYGSNEPTLTSQFEWSVNTFNYSVQGARVDKENSSRLTIQGARVDKENSSRLTLQGARQQY